MKRIIFLLTCLVVIQTAAFAGKDRMITVDQLPNNAQQFIEKYFANVAVSYAKMDSEIFDTSYEVIFVNGSKVEFDRKGEWTDVDCKFSEVPTGIVPSLIQDYVMAHHKDMKVVEIDRDNKDYEIKLSNKLELKFDLKYNLIGYDY